MLRKAVLLAALFSVAAVSLSNADEVKFGFGAEANTVSFGSTTPLPTDFEAGGVGALSLTPHFGIHGSVLFGLSHSYLRGTVGPRITATDVDNQNFSAGFGVEYQACSEPALRPEEWGVNANVGLKPWPEQVPNLIFGAQGTYGLRTGGGMLLLGATYILSSKL